MRKCVVYSGKWLGVIIVLLLTTHYCLVPIFAASPSPSPKAGLTEFQQKVDDLKKDAASRAAELKSQVSRTIQNKAFIGQVLGVNNLQISLQSPKGTRTINTDEYTVFQDAAKKGFVLKDIKKDDFLIALGDVDDNQVLKAKKIIRSKPPAAVEKSVVWGQFQSIVSGTITLLKQDNQKVSIKTDGKTLFRLGSEEMSLQDIKLNNFISEGKNLFIIAVGSKLNNNSSNATFVYLLDPKGDLKIEKSASSSATPSASPRKSVSQ